MAITKRVLGVLILICGIYGLASVPVCAQAASQQPPAGTRDLFVTVGKSLVVESPVNIQRVSVGDARVAEAVAVSPREVLVNGKLPGETSLIMWQQGGNRLLFDLRVRPSTSRLEAVRQEIKEALPDQDIAITQEGDNIYLRGTVRDMTLADRAIAIAGTLGKPINMLSVQVPSVEQQILLKVRFANVDRQASRELGANLFSTGALNTIGATSTQQFQPPSMTVSQGQAQTNLTDLLNVFLFRPDLNLGATIRALQSRSLLEILAEPNLLAINGREASFLAGGEFPVPVVQSGFGGGGAVTITWREFGIRIRFTPMLTPRGSIRLKVAPEVSSLDLANSVIISGFRIPALSSRKVNTEIELDSGQSFAIAGLLDNRVVESWNKIPGLGDIPLIGKIFQSQARAKNNTELLVVVTPELVRPVPAGQPALAVQFPEPFLEGTAAAPPRTPGVEATGATSPKPLIEAMPYEQLQAIQQQMKDQPATPQVPMIQLVPAMPQAQPGTAPAAGAPPAAQATPR